MRSSVWSFLNIYLLYNRKTSRQGRPNSHINLTDEMTTGNEIVPLEDIPNDQDGQVLTTGMEWRVQSMTTGMEWRVQPMTTGMEWMKSI